MVTRQQMDNLGRVARNLTATGQPDQALMAWIDGLDASDSVSIWRWTNEHMHLVRARPDDGPLVGHNVLWRNGPYIQSQPEYRVTVGDGVDHDFTTPLGAATFIVTGRDVNAPALSYRITVHEPGKTPEVEFEVVRGIDEAVDIFLAEVDLTADGQHGWTRSRDFIRHKVTTTGSYDVMAVTPDGTTYRHVIERER